MDGMIQTGRFEEFVDNFVDISIQEKEEQFEWEFWLHRVWEGTFKEFKESLENNKNNQNLSNAAIETTVQDSLNILKNFTPEKGGE